MLMLKISSLVFVPWKTYFWLEKQKRGGGRAISITGYFNLFSQQTQTVSSLAHRSITSVCLSGCWDDWHKKATKQKRERERASSWATNYSLMAWAAVRLWRHLAEGEERAGRPNGVLPPNLFILSREKILSQEKAKMHFFNHAKEWKHEWNTL